VGRAVAALAADPQLHRRNGGSFSSGGLARDYGFTDLDGSQPDCWRYLVEVQDAGLPADPTGYRCRWALSTNTSGAAGFCLQYSGLLHVFQRSDQVDGVRMAG
jgi:hypothetical protein